MFFLTDLSNRQYFIEWTTCLVSLDLTKIILFLSPARPEKCGSITTLQRLPRFMSETEPLPLLFIKKKKYLQEAEATPDKVMKEYFTAVPILLRASGEILPGSLNDCFTCTCPEAVSIF